MLDAEVLYADNVTDGSVYLCATSKPGQALIFQDLWSMPLERFDGHLYAQIDFPTITFYTVKQLE